MLHPLTQYKVLFPNDWELLQRQAHDKVWLGRGEQQIVTHIPAHLLQPVVKSQSFMKDGELVEFKQTGKSILKKVPVWNAPPSSKTPDELRMMIGAPVADQPPKPRKTVSIADRNPTMGDKGCNSNYLDLRDKKIRGPNFLYVEGEKRPLDEEERRRARLIVLKNGKKSTAPSLNMKSLLNDHPVRGGYVGDTWSSQGLSYYAFMVGGRYNRFDTFDDLLFRDYGIFLPRDRPGAVYFSKQSPIETESHTPAPSRGQSSLGIGEVSTDKAPSMTTSAGGMTSSSSGRLRFHAAPTLSTSGEATSSSNRNSRLNYAENANSTASSAFYYESNAKSVQALMDRLAGSMATPRRYAPPQTYNTRTILKGGRGGRSFSFSFRPRPLQQPRPSGEAPAELRRSTEIDQLISLGHQLATSHGSHDE